MGTASVGEIGLDLVVNQNQFKKQMTGITGLAKKAGATLAAAFAVKKIVDFGKECVNLGSDLAEVQNVVDVTFPRMTAQVDKFAKDAAASFGLSETMAKKFTGTFGAMAKAFGFSEREAYDMSTTLTGLAGDVASFYNISQDEAYTKLKSVFTGETETLKDLGVVMTQNALDAYAMANGYGKVTAKMSEAEKVALRYAFVQNQLTAATGDFTRTSDSWANQVRILKLNFESLKATIGQGLISVLTPVIKVINSLLAKLMALASAFKSFVALITGKKADSGSGGIGVLGAEAATAGDNLGSAAGAADSLADSAKGAGGAAKKAAKEMKALMGFDVVNKLQDQSDDSGDGGSGGGGSGGAGGGGVDFGSLSDGDTIIDKLDSKFQKLIDRMKELAALFKKGFSIGFGDSEKRIDEIKEHLSGIKQSLTDILTDERVVQAANNLWDSLALNAGKVAGSFASIGVTLATNLIGGIDRYLSDNKDYIKNRLVSIFDANSEILNHIGDICTNIADVFSVFANTDGKRITASIIGIFADAGLGMTEVISRDVEHLLGVISDVIKENKEKLKTSIANTLAPIAVIGESLHKLVQNTFSKLSEVYDTYIDPSFKRIKNGFSEVFGAALDAYNTYLAPVLDWISQRFSELASTYIQPLLDSFLNLWGQATEAVSVFWEFISPFVSWFVEKFIAVFASKLEWLWTKFEAVFGLISSLLTGFMDILKGLIEFIVGVFTGDWDKAWNGIKTIFSGIWDMISKIVESAWNFICNTIKTFIDKAKNTIQVKLDGIKTFMSGIWDTIKNIAKTAWDSIKNFITNPIQTAKDVLTSVLGAIQSKFSSAFNAIKNAVKGPINSIIGFLNRLIQGMASAVNSIARMFNSMSFSIPDWVPVFGGGRLGFNLPTWSPGSIPYLAQGGYVKANAPQLAMIGDNRHQGEIVAPEDKLQDMVNTAVKAVAGSGGISKAELESIINNAVMRIIAALGQMGFFVDGQLMAKALQKATEELNYLQNPVKIV